MRQHSWEMENFLLKTICFLLQVLIMDMIYFSHGKIYLKEVGSQ